MLLRLFLIATHLLIALFLLFAIVGLSDEMADDWLGINQAAVIIISVALMMSAVAVWAIFKSYRWSHMYAWAILLAYFVTLFLSIVMFVGFDSIGS